MSKVIYKFDVEFERDHERSYSRERRIGYTHDGLLGIHFYPEDEAQVDQSYKNRGYQIIKDNSKHCSTELKTI